MGKKKAREIVLPNSLNPAPKVFFDVLYDPATPDLGYTNVDKRIVVLNPNQSGVELLKTHIHEACHAWDHSNPPKGKKKDFHFKHKDVYRIEEFVLWYLKELKLL